MSTAQTKLDAADRLWTIDDVAAFLGVPPRTLYQWRYHRSGPPSCRVGRYVRYDPAAVRAWVQTQLSQAEEDTRP